jgi:hypothetical protein
MSSQTLGNPYGKEGSNIHCLTIFTMAWFNLGSHFFFSSEILPKREIKKLKIENEVIY